MTCKHISTTLIWKAVDDGPDIAIARECRDCSNWLTLGPSNDEQAEVQVEVRAAELLTGTVKLRQFSSEQFGWEDHVDGAYDPGATDMDSIGYLSGWLACEIATHSYRESRDADAWPWDTTRPVAGQYEEWISADIAKAASDALARGSELGARRIAFLESDQAQAIVANTTATLDRLRPSRVPYAEDQLPLPVVSSAVLPPLTPAEEHAHGVIAIADRDIVSMPMEVQAMLDAEGLVRFELEPIADIVTDARLKALEAGQVEIALAQVAPDALPSRLRQARGIAGLGIGQAARKLEIPYSELEEIEQGKQEISEFDLLAFADAYSVSLVWLKTGAGLPRPEKIAGPQ